MPSIRLLGDSDAQLDADVLLALLELAGRAQAASLLNRRHLLGSTSSHHAVALSWQFELPTRIHPPRRLQATPKVPDVVVTATRHRVVASARAIGPLFCELFLVDAGSVDHPEHQHQRRSRLARVGPSCRPEPYAQRFLRHQVYIACLLFPIGAIVATSQRTP